MDFGIYNYEGKSTAVMDEFKAGEQFLKDNLKINKQAGEHVAFYPRHPLYGSCWMVRDRMARCLAMAKNWKELPEQFQNSKYVSCPEHTSTKNAFVEFCPCGADTYVCQQCITIKCGAHYPSIWRIGIGNICPGCQL